MVREGYRHAWHRSHQGQGEARDLLEGTRRGRGRTLTDLQERRVAVSETGKIPALDVVFGFGPTLPFIVGAVLAWWLSEPWRLVALHLAALWGTAILLFLSGVRRGLSFRTEGGPTWRQIATMLALFGLGGLSLGAIWLEYVSCSLVLLLIGYSAVLFLDPIAAAAGEAPLYFRTLRRLQMPIIVLSLIGLIAIAARG